MTDQLHRKIRWLIFFLLLFTITTVAFLSLILYWQLIPFISIFIVISLYIILHYLRLIKLSLSRKLLLIILSFIILITILILILIPFINLPTPSGIYNIGTKHFIVINSSRNCVNNNGIYSPRELQIQVWYPSRDITDANPDPYLQDAREYSKQFSTMQGTPIFPFILNHLGKIKTNSYQNLHVDTTQKFPVIIFSHGLGQYYKFNSIFIEELASHGYVVVGMQHPNCENLLNENNNTNLNKRILDSVMNKINETDNIHELRKLYKIFYDNMPVNWNNRNTAWANDILCVVDHLKLINETYLEESIDINSLGVIGFSFGGGAAGLAAMSDTTVKAGINLDGWQPGHLKKKYFNCPFLFITSNIHSGSNDFFINYSNQDVNEIIINETAHANFNDMALISGLAGKLIGKKGEINAKYALNIQKEIIVSFFNEKLKGEAYFNSKNLCNKYPEVSLNSN